jgi:hypothetical protein
MATPNQIAANKASAQKSTGPKTPEGKAKSAANRLSHGFTSSATIMPGEDPEEFKALVDDLIAHCQPANPIEQILVEKMAIGQWLSLRAFRLQGYVFLGESLKGEKSAMPKDLGLLIRYQTASDRAFQRAHTELVKAQKERKKSEIGFEPQNAEQPTKPEESESHGFTSSATIMDYRIVPEYTFLTPEKAAAAANIPRVTSDRLSKAAA